MAFFAIFVKLKDVLTSKAFKEYDLNKDGLISYREFEKVSSYDIHLQYVCALHLCAKIYIHTYTHIVYTYTHTYTCYRQWKHNRDTQSKLHYEVVFIIVDTLPPAFTYTHTHTYMHVHTQSEKKWPT